jgi:ParB family transcriptional regulator, chromosome partitioning protein
MSATLLQESQELKAFNVPMGKIFCDNDFNCRGAIPPYDVIDLAQSIDKNGLQQPIIVQPWDKKAGKEYRIISGHRRYTAFKVLNKETIPAVIQPNLDELEARKLNLEENLKRKNLNMLQEAKAIQPFLDAGWTQKETAERFTQPLPWVHIRSLLLRLPAEIQQEAAAGFLTQEHIRQLSQLVKKPDQMYAAVRKIKESKLAGERKLITVSEKKTKAHSKRMRTRAEIFTLMNIISSNIGPGFYTRVLAWAAGEVSEFEIHRDFRNFAKELDVEYEIPKELLESALT